MPRGAPLALASLLSGGAALAYQILWARQLGLVLGAGTEAVAVVLSSFMAGLGLGGAIAARRLGTREPEDAAGLVRAYAGLEGIIAGAALALPWAWAAAPAGLAVLYEGPAAWPAGFRLARLAFAFAALLVPASAMGATLPVLIALARPAAGRAAATAGALYGWNATGALAGALLTPLVAMPALGLTRTTLLAAAANLAAALAVWLGRRPEAAPRVPSAVAGWEAVRPDARGAQVALVVTFLSGLGALAHEVAWTRALVLLVGPTTYAFAFVLAAVIGGLAAGSALCARVADRLARPALALVAVQAGVVAAAAFLTSAIGALPLLVGESARALADDPTALLRRQAAGTFALLFLPSALFGATFPLCVRLLAEAGRPAGAAAARLLAANTAGAVVGPLLAGLFVLPAFGLEATLKAAALVHATAALVASTAARPLALAPRAAWAAVAIVPAVALFLLPRWDLELLAGGAYRYAHESAGPGELRQRLRAGELLYHRDGTFATVSVKRLGGALALSVDGKVDATNTGDMPTQRLLGHLPLLLHGAAREVLVVGLGSGATAAAVLAHPVDRLQVAEISPEVIEAARLHFGGVQRGALQDPRLRLRLEDGRNHLLLGSARYDVIVSEPSNPWMAGVASLFTRDFFALARARLREGGVLCQWMHVYGMPLPAVQSVLGGFADVFPDSAVFQVSEGDLLLVGSAGPWPEPAPEELARRFRGPGVAADLATIGLTEPAVLATMFVLGPGGLGAFAGEAARHTDDRPLLELAAARAMTAGTAAENRRALLAAAEGRAPPSPWRELREAAGPSTFVERGRLLEKSTSLALALEAYGRALRLDPRSAAAQDGLVRIAAESDARAPVEALLGHLAATGPDPLGARVALARLYRATGRAEEAGRLVAGVLTADSSHRRALKLGAALQGDLGQTGMVEVLAGRAFTLDPTDAEAAALLASASLGAGDLAMALERADEALRLEPSLELALRARALALARLARTDEARAAFEALVGRPGASWRSFLHQGAFLADLGDWAGARRAFETAVDLSPESPEAWEALRRAAEAPGDRDDPGPRLGESSSGG